MATFNQISSKEFRLKKKKRNKVLGLLRCPQRKGQCVRIFIRTPKKPSSGRRKVTRVRLTNSSMVTCHIPGMGGHNLQKFSTVLVRGCHVRDIPAIRYRVIRNKYDLKFVYDRLSSRSKYGKSKFFKGV